MEDPWPGVIYFIFLCFEMQCLHFAVNRNIEEVGGATRFRCSAHSNNSDQLPQFEHRLKQNMRNTVYSENYSDRMIGFIDSYDRTTLEIYLHGQR